tara:strand:- start:328 stop:759 length:432 start_codon:yes stop_codon:yes gene_type:complete
MTTKDYKAIASDLNSVYKSHDTEQKLSEWGWGFHIAVSTLCRTFEEDNPRFDVAMFQAAVYKVEDMITIEHARFIASEYHCGQGSALYAFSSSGTITCGIVREINECLNARDIGGFVSDRRGRMQIFELRSLLDFINSAIEKI